MTLQDLTLTKDIDGFRMFRMSNYTSKYYPMNPIDEQGAYEILMAHMSAHPEESFMIQTNITRLTQQTKMGEKSACALILTLIRLGILPLES